MTLARIAPGCRRLTPALVQVQAIAERFQGLPDAVSKGQALAALKQAAQPLGLSSRLRDAVDVLFAFSQPQDWQPDARPIVWPVRRRDLWTGKRYDEVLSLDPRHVDLSRLNGGAPLLNTHGAFDLAGVIGVVERARIARSGEGYEGRAAVRFSARDDVEPLWQDVRAGIIRNVSIGYVVRAYDVSEPDGQVPVWRAVDWQPVELSAVPVADGGAGFRQSQPLTACRLISTQQTSRIDRAQHAQQLEKTDMDEPMTAAGTDAADSLASGRADEGERPEPTLIPEAAVAEQHAPTRSDSPTLMRSDHPRHDDRGADPAGAEDVARRVVAEERARIAGIYDAARKLGLDQAGSRRDDARCSPRPADRPGGRARPADRDPAAHSHRRSRRAGGPARCGGDGAAAPLRSAPVCAERTGARLARRTVGA